MRTNLEAEKPLAQFEVLYGLNRDVTSLHGEIADEGAVIPSEVMPYLYRFFELTESTAKESM